MTGVIGVVREQDIKAAAGKVWALASSLEAWSLWPGHFAFAVGTSLSSLTRRVGCLVSATRDGVSSDFIIASAGKPGRVISWASRSTPHGGQIIALSVLPRDLGWTSTLQISVRDASGRFRSERDATKYWHRELDLWLGRLKRVAEGALPWPGTGMPEQMQRACVPPPPAREFLTSSASVRIQAPLELVWEMAAAPDMARVVHPEHVAEAGYVPGTPERAAGAIEYNLHKRAGEDIEVELNIVTEFVPRRRAVTRSVEPPHTEATFYFQPGPDGTQLEFISRWPSHMIEVDPQVQVAAVAQGLQRGMDRFKAAVEERAGGTRPVA
jgi:hypothetical protein